MIRVQFRRTNVEVSEALRTHAESRLRLGLARFVDRVERVIVRFSHPDGEGRGSHKRCEIKVVLRPEGVHVEDIDRDLFAAVNHATDRASRSVARAIEREAPR